MAVKETIAIAGATGRAGAVIARRLALNDFRVLLISADIAKLAKLAAEIKALKPTAETEQFDCLKEACWEADIIVLAVHREAEKEVAEKIKEVATQKIVVRFNSFENIDLNVVRNEDELQQLLPYSKIVTANINIDLRETTVITGGDEEAVETILNIATKAGFTVAAAQKLQQ